MEFIINIEPKNPGDILTADEFNMMVQGINTAIANKVDKVPGSGLIVISERNKLAAMPYVPVRFYSNANGWYIRDVETNTVYAWDGELKLWVNTEDSGLSLPQTVETVEWETGNEKPEISANYIIGDFIEGKPHQVITITLNDIYIKRIVAIEEN